MAFILQQPLIVIIAAVLILDVVWAFVSLPFDVSRNKKFIWQTINKVVTIIGLAGLVYAFLINRPTVRPGVDLELFHVLSQAASNETILTAVKTCILFCGLFGLGCFWALSPRLLIWVRISATVLLGAVVGILIEVTQYYARLGSIEIDFVVVCIAGALLGALTGVARGVLNVLKFGPANNMY